MAGKSNWGENYDQTFDITNLTTTFSDNSRVALTPAVIQAFVYIDYTKGNEDELQVLVEYSPVFDDTSPSNLFFADTISDNDGTTETFIFRFTQSGTFRIPVQLGESEDRIRVSCRGAGTPPFTGTASLYCSVR